MEREQKEERAKQAFELDQSIKGNEKQRRKLLISNILDLIKMHDNGLYKSVLGEGVEPKWSGYLSDVGVFYTRSKIARWRRIITKLIQQYNLDINNLIDVPETRLEDIVRISKNKEDAELLIEKAKLYIGMDWINLVRTAKGKPTMEDCPHNFEVYRVCKDCGAKSKQQITSESVN